jgi:hypothetical protein
MTNIALWLVLNTLLPLLPIPLFYLAIWLFRGTISWVTPIRDGQICFYSTTIAILTLKDIFDAHANAKWGFFGLVGCWIVSLFIYGFSIFSTIYPPRQADRDAIDLRCALASISCGVLTTVTVISLRSYYGILR